jgi:hypothetical protein
MNTYIRSRTCNHNIINIDNLWWRYNKNNGEEYSNEHTEHGMTVLDDKELIVTCRHVRDTDHPKH